MPIRAVLLDVSGTLISDTNTGVPTVAPGVPEMIEWLESHNIETFLASNHAEALADAQAIFDLPSENLLSPEEVGGKKGTGKFVEAVCARLGIGRQNLVYLGDDQFDFYEAINNGVLFFLASWANSSLQYGIEMESPADFIDMLATFFCKQDLWYYVVDGQDKLGRPVIVRVLLGPDEAISSGIRELLKSQGKDRGQPIAGYELEGYLTLHLLSSVYLEGLHLRSPGSKTLWCLYPGHTGAQVGTLDEFAQIAAHLFRKQFQQDLIHRHTQSESNRERRLKKRPVVLQEQLRTINLLPELRAKVKDRFVFVVDDFTTEGFGFEAARNFFLNAGAREVACIAVGKYGYSSSWQAFRPKSNIIWDSYAPANLSDDDFITDWMPATFNKGALDYFKSTYRPITGIVQKPKTEQVEASVHKAKSGNAHPLLQQAQNQWGQIRQNCKQKSNAVAALLVSVWPIGILEGDVPTLVLRTGYQYHRNRLCEPDYTSIVEWAVGEVLNTPVSISVVVA